MKEKLKLGSLTEKLIIRNSKEIQMYSGRDQSTKRHQSATGFIPGGTALEIATIKQVM